MSAPYLEVQNNTVIDRNVWLAENESLLFQIDSVLDEDS
jgi:hypothetical protein